MALDIDAAIDTAYALESNISEMVSILRVYKEGKISIQEIGDVEFSTAQKQILADKYVTLKSNLQTLYSQLP